MRHPLCFSALGTVLGALSLAACGGPPAQVAPAGAEAPGEPVVAVAPLPEEVPEDGPPQAPEPRREEPAAVTSAEPLEDCIAAVRDGRGLSAAAQSLPEASLYTAALADERAGAMDAARKGFFKLIQQHPKSPFLPLAYFAFGEMFLREAQGDPSKIPLATASFDEVLKYPPPDNAAYLLASLRLATAHGRKPDSMGVLVSTKRVLSGVTQSPSTPCAAALAVAASDQMVVAYSDAGRPEVAFSFFRGSASEEPAYGMLASLAEVYIAGKNFDSGVKALLSAPGSGAPAAFCAREAKIMQAHGLSIPADQRARLTTAHAGRCPKP